ncbi:MAG: hypothetical protein GY734_21780 [Herbaspirillum sp.]|uniref:hypothetical protein n=1 Tax=Herbaspirillum sp. TaxID=1890675 RepID=UPI002583AC7F|nr:hypothetical protein [Herbaspirillum sp.]MCP3658497.1 hypothetical protein [Herbaspirillum sp.]MCP4033850.1 hypothetical protein [Herbaspirillum sp.]
MKPQTKLEFFGREGFLDVSKQPDFGTRTLYTAGLDNLADKSVYVGLIADLNKRERNKKNNTEKN